MFEEEIIKQTVPPTLLQSNYTAFTVTFDPNIRRDCAQAKLERVYFYVALYSFGWIGLDVCDLKWVCSSEIFLISLISLMDITRYYTQLCRRATPHSCTEGDFLYNSPVQILLRLFRKLWVKSRIHRPSVIPPVLANRSLFRFYQH